MPCWANSVAAVMPVGPAPMMITGTKSGSEAGAPLGCAFMRIPPCCVGCRGRWRRRRWPPLPPRRHRDGGSWGSSPVRQGMSSDPFDAGSRFTARELLELPQRPQGLDGRVEHVALDAHVLAHLAVAPQLQPQVTKALELV